MATKRKSERSFDATRKYNEYMRNYRKRKQADRLRSAQEKAGELSQSSEALQAIKEALKGGESK